jgi:hypothetical protein
MEQETKSPKIVRLSDGSRRIRLRLDAETATYLKNAGAVVRPARGYEVRVLENFGRELTAEIHLTASAYEALSAKARAAGKRRGEFVEATIRRLLEHLLKRSHEEALDLTREFIKANSDWLLNRSFVDV